MTFQNKTSGDKRYIKGAISGDKFYRFRGQSNHKTLNFRGQSFFHFSARQGNIEHQFFFPIYENRFLQIFSNLKLVHTIGRICLSDQI